MEKVSGVLLMTIPEMLYFLVLIIAHHLMLIIQKNNFLVLSKAPAEGINGSVDAAGKKIILTLVKQIQNFA